MGRHIPLSKRLFRQVFTRLPRTKASFNIGKIVTRLFLKPESHAVEACFDFADLIPMRLDLSEFASNDIYCLDTHFESVSLKLWRELAYRAHTILDLGSHIGTFALTAAAINSQAKIIAVEICQRNLTYLKINSAPYRNIEVCEVAIGPKSGYYLFQEDDKSGGGYIKLCERDYNCSTRKRKEAPNSYEVEAVTLSQLCRKAAISQVDLMKMDLEGLEYELLTGQEEFWHTYDPTHVIVEIGYPKQQQEKIHAILQSMSRRGYAYRKCQNLYALGALKKEKLANWYFWKERVK